MVAERIEDYDVLGLVEHAHNRPDELFRRLYGVLHLDGDSRGAGLRGVLEVMLCCRRGRISKEPQG